MFVNFLISTLWIPRLFSLVGVGLFLWSYWSFLRHCQGQSGHKANLKLILDKSGEWGEMWSVKWAWCTGNTGSRNWDSNWISKEERQGTDTAQAPASSAHLTITLNIDPNINRDVTVQSKRVDKIGCLNKYLVEDSPNICGNHYLTSFPCSICSCIKGFDMADHKAYIFKKKITPKPVQCKLQS